MKKIISVLFAALLVLAASASAETAFVSISNGQGELVLAREAIELSDADNDGLLTISDALSIAHDLAFDGGAAEGYLAEDQGYGLSLYKLWGEDNGGSYGYYVNNTSAFSLTDSVSGGDHVKAYAYTDLETWSDTYCYFDVENVSGVEVELTLTALIFDADWNRISVPVEGAIITVDGVDSSALTDAEGKVALTLPDESKHLISARSENMVLVPPVCIANDR